MTTRRLIPLFILVVSITPAAAQSVDSSLAGSVPDGMSRPGSPLMLRHAANGMIELTWGHSCDDDDADYAIYEGVLGDYTSHRPVACSTAGAMSVALPTPGHSTYYLIVPLSTSNEGSYGVDSLGRERPASTEACLPQGRKSCERARCERGGGYWTDCGPPSPHCFCEGALCGLACFPQCLCGGFAGFGCPPGKTCDVADQCGADLFGICQ